MKSVLSARTSLQIEHIFAVVCKDERGMEGVVRRVTPFGTQPWTTDDASVKDEMLRLAKEASGFDDAYLVRFDRVYECPLCTARTPQQT